MKTLMFGTLYIDTEARRDLTEKWWTLHTALNPGCDLLLVDSASPLIPCAPVHVLQLGDNIGHLGKGGRDGWGRAFCAGLKYAIDHGYDHVVHVEGDSLLRRPVAPLCQFMVDHHLPTFVCGVNGTKLREFAWIETGIMFLSVPYVRDSRFIERYNWQNGEAKRYPHTPEAVIYEMLDQDGALNIVPLRVMRDDRNVLTKENVRKYDWITHTSPDIYSTFATSTTVTA